MELSNQTRFDSLQLGNVTTRFAEENRTVADKEAALGKLISSGERSQPNEQNMANICDDDDTVSALDPNNRDILNVVEELGNVEEKLPDELGAILCSTPAGNASMILSLTCTY